MISVDDVGYMVDGALCVSVVEIAKKLEMDADLLLRMYKKFGDINFAVDYVKRNTKTLEARGSTEVVVKDTKKRGHVIEGNYYSSIKKIEDAYDIPSKRLQAAYLKSGDIETAFNFVQTHDYGEHARKIREQDNVRVGLIMKGKELKGTVDTAYFDSYYYTSV